MSCHALCLLPREFEKISHTDHQPLIPPHQPCKIVGFNSQQPLLISFHTYPFRLPRSVLCVISTSLISLAERYRDQKLFLILHANWQNSITSFSLHFRRRTPSSPQQQQQMGTIRFSRISFRSRSFEPSLENQPLYSFANHTAFISSWDEGRRPYYIYILIHCAPALFSFIPATQSARWCCERSFNCTFFLLANSRKCITMNAWQMQQEFARKKK